MEKLNIDKDLESAYYEENLNGRRKKGRGKTLVVSSPMGTPSPQTISVEGTPMKKKKGLKRLAEKVGSTAKKVGRGVSRGTVAVVKSKAFRIAAPIALGAVGLGVLAKKGKLKGVSGGVKKLASKLSPSKRSGLKSSKKTQSNTGNALLPLLPLMPTMGKSLRRKGLNPPKSVEARAQMFHTEIVVPNSYERSINFDAYEASDNLDASIVTSIISFIKNTKSKKDNGEKLSPLMDSIVEDVSAVTEKLKIEAERAGINVQEINPDGSTSDSDNTREGNKGFRNSSKKSKNPLYVGMDKDSDAPIYKNPIVIGLGAAALLGLLLYKS